MLNETPRKWLIKPLPFHHQTHFRLNLIMRRFMKVKGESEYWTWKLPREKVLSDHDQWDFWTTPSPEIMSPQEATERRWSLTTLFHSAHRVFYSTLLNSSSCYFCCVGLDWKRCMRQRIKGREVTNMAADCQNFQDDGKLWLRMIM